VSVARLAATVPPSRCGVRQGHARKTRAPYALYCFRQAWKKRPTV